MWPSARQIPFICLGVVGDLYSLFKIRDVLVYTVIDSPTSTLTCAGLVTLLTALLGGRRAPNGYKVLLGHDPVRSAFAGALTGHGLGIHTSH